ncbi:hypothetical protein G3I59_31210 [Amycolatopsis rubida]|uniref:Transposase n=1 Tax=Amycolatopsis rubida TaxID=112413 RepID=A0ABX0C4J1_9PSEU|nr:MULTISPECIES: hypothetical protein [Amycolatopsis]MYW94949.1 hypothetical protein [Amycolatopsis rubida]NEC59936.1 hypothetical protein [Amycolatopsis rubida]OAP25673.1 hypothetical protein A4R44_03047 [Amycolatopsis sp. M39]
MRKARRIRVRGAPRKNPDVELVAQAIIQLGREIWEREKRDQQADETPEDGRQ